MYSVNGILSVSCLLLIHSQKLYRPETSKADTYADLQLILTRPIDWELVRQQYKGLHKARCDTTQ